MEYIKSNSGKASVIFCLGTVVSFISASYTSGVTSAVLWGLGGGFIFVALIILPACYYRREQSKNNNFEIIEDSTPSPSPGSVRSQQYFTSQKRDRNPSSLEDNRKRKAFADYMKAIDKYQMYIEILHENLRALNQSREAVIKRIESKKRDKFSFFNFA